VKISATRLAAAAGAGALALGLMVPAADAQQYPVTVTGTATCSHAGPVGRYTLNWTVANGDGLDLTVTSANQSGVTTGDVTFTPSPIPSNSSGTGSFGPVGNVAGTVTLTVAWSAGTGQPQTGTSTGTITLAGDCVNDPGTTVAPTTTSTPPTTVAAVNAVPAFTG
jgi:hypothetical protein